MVRFFFATKAQKNALKNCIEIGAGHTLAHVVVGLSPAQIQDFLPPLEADRLES